MKNNVGCNLLRQCVGLKPDLQRKRITIGCNSLQQGIH